MQFTHYSWGKIWFDRFDLCEIFCNSANYCKQAATVYALGSQQHVLSQQCNNVSGSRNHSFSFMWKMLPQRWLNGAGGPRLGKCNTRKSFFDSVLKMSKRINPFRSQPKGEITFSRQLSKKQLPSKCQELSWRGLNMVNWCLNMADRYQILR